MSSLTSEVLRTLSEIERLTASLGLNDPSTEPTFNWQNNDYPAIAAVEVKGNLFGPGGLTPDNNLTLTVRKSVFTGDTPLPDQFVTFNEHNYRIDVVKPSPDGTAFIFVCNDPDRGAGIVEREI